MKTISLCGLGTTIIFSVLHGCTYESPTTEIENPSTSSSASSSTNSSASSGEQSASSSSGMGGKGGQGQASSSGDHGGNGGKGGAGGAGNAGAGGTGEIRIEVACSNAGPCKSPECCCFDRVNAYECTPPDTCLQNGKLALSCDGPEDCPGATCCAIWNQNAIRYDKAECSPECTLPNRVVCHPDQPAVPPCMMNQFCASDVILGPNYGHCQ